MIIWILAIFSENKLKLLNDIFYDEDTALAEAMKRNALLDNECHYRIVKFVQSRY